MKGFEFEVQRDYTIRVHNNTALVDINGAAISIDLKELFLLKKLVDKAINELLNQ